MANFAKYTHQRKCDESSRRTVTKLDSSRTRLLGMDSDSTVGTQSTVGTGRGRPVQAAAPAPADTHQTLPYFTSKL